jgi:PucR C-terminal helix-turn-helix domain/GGDEF-like domain
MPTLRDYPTTALTAALKRLRASIGLARAAKYLSAHAAQINAELGKTVLAEIPAYSESRNPEILPELAAHGAAHTDELLRLLRGSAVGDFEFVRKHARRRAEQHFPLEAALHAYRCGHKVFSRWLREAILTTPASTRRAPASVAALADFALEYTDAVSTVAAAAYVAQTRLLADVAGDRRAELLNILLEGYDESDGRVAQILREAGYLDGRQSYCVVLARPVDATEMFNAARARRLADAVGGLLRESNARRLIDVRDNKVTAVFSDTRRASGWTAPNTALAKRISAEAATLGNAVLIGISNDVPSTSRIPEAHREGLHALAIADVVRRVVQFSDIPARRLLLHLAGAEFQRAVPAWASELLHADEKSGGALSATLRAYADADMNVLKAAEKIAIHPNTVYARMQRVSDLTGLDARTYHGLTELLIAVDCAGR